MVEVRLFHLPDVTLDFLPARLICREGVGGGRWVLVVFFNEVNSSTRRRGQLVGWARRALSLLFCL